MAASTAAPSLALIEANRRLQKQQAQARSARQAEGWQGEHSSLGEVRSRMQPESAAAIIATLPDHLGWGSAPMTALLRRRGQQKSKPVAGESGREGNSGEGAAADQTNDHDLEGQGEREVVSLYANDLLNTLASGDWVKLYPDIGLGMLRREMTAPGRLWLMLRAIDKEGQGSIPIERAKELLVKESSPLRLCGQRQWRNLLREGDGVFWIRDREQIWLKSVAKVAFALGVERLTGQPVGLSVTALLAGIGAFRAHLYTAFHSGRSKESVRGRQAMPIARVTLAGLSGVGASSQRAYEKQTKLKVQANFAVGEVATEENRENRAWVQGQAVFELTDYRGQQGRKGETYLAWQLPNSYLGQHQHRPKGRQKRINRELKDLVMQGMPGNVEERADTHPEKRYYPNGKEAGRGRGRGRGQESDVYWQQQRTRKRQFVLWQQMGNG
ncbi:MAG: hypothetical protein KA314_19275 [Chloroflexi bacterium]|nr:hypothetical protein [Chloroflexota bacterium]MBP8057975.1 hypothetical protein [Chloroflexota bacterium]